MARVRAASLVSLTLTVISAATSAQNYAAPKTPWGDPDLQGIWSGDSAFGARRAGAHSSGERRRFLPQRQRLGDEVFPADVAHRRSTERTCEPPVAGAEKRRTPQGTYGSGPFNSPEDFTAYDRCLTLGVVGSMTPKIYGNGYRIVQAPGYVVLMAEMIHEARVISLDGRPHINDGIRSYMGDSRGHWEGNTLVVETTNFNGKLGSTRSEDLHAAIHDLDPRHVTAWISGAAVRVSRREPGDSAGTRRRARRGQGAR